ncbi:hypothetical protein J5N97_022637 [Dioscorea zingiberensis]|uniref:Uncharacterized protein n=1 Tax=Dioscorea zingiberensis TaxID=325984 RepID=A0A9D5CCC2_9LILI|nr:hypothetical protein J5N97_022637 [Dioscorea zingiberensis]
MPAVLAQLGGCPPSQRLSYNRARRNRPRRPDPARLASQPAVAIRHGAPAAGGEGLGGPVTVSAREWSSTGSPRRAPCHRASDRREAVSPFRPIPAARPRLAERCLHSDTRPPAGAPSRPLRQDAHPPRPPAAARAPRTPLPRPPRPRARRVRRSVGVPGALSDSMPPDRGSFGGGGPVPPRPRAPRKQTQRKSDAARARVRPRVPAPGARGAGARAPAVDP